MKKHSLRVTAYLLAATFLFASCSSSTTINSLPSGAKVYLNGEPVGTTPYRHTDTKIVGSQTSVKLEKDGYETLNTGFAKNEQVDVGAIVGGVFVLIPFLWTMKYKPEHTYELTPQGGKNAVVNQKKSSEISFSKSEELRTLKKLLDDKILTAEEYDIEKKKILDK